MRIVFAGTPQFAVPALKSLIDLGAQITAVYTQPDRRAGRGRRLRSSPVKLLAQEHGLTVVQPATLKEESTRLQMAALEPDVMVVVAYGQILPTQILNLPKVGCLNVHASLLPRWRGAAPIARAIEAGDQITGATLMQMDSGLDTGAIIAKSEIEVDETDNSGKPARQAGNSGRGFTGELVAVLCVRGIETSGARCRSSNLRTQTLKK